MSLQLQLQARQSKARLQPRRCLLVGIFVAAFLLICCIILQPNGLLPGSQYASTTDLSGHRLPPHQYAYAAFLAAPEEESRNDDDDKYFVGVRMIAYSLLHDPKTKSQAGIPLIVLVTDEVTDSKRARLEADGAAVVTVGKLSFDWIQASRERWRDVLSKLFLFTLTQYERVLFLDSDTLIARPMDDIFHDPAATLQVTAHNASNAPSDEGIQPRDFVFGGVSGQGGYGHPWPPHRGDSCNAGFVLFRPNHALFHHYLRVAENAVGRFNPQYPEQNLWNYVHRRDGNMPWQQVDPRWNVNWATVKDWHSGVRSLHTKWWNPGPESALKDFALALKWKMEGNAVRLDRDREERLGMWPVKSSR